MLSWLRGPLATVVAIMCAVAVSAAIAYAVSVKVGEDRDAALRAYLTDARDETELAAKAVAASFDQIYQNLRTISLLASVRRIDRHAENLPVEGRQAVQQIFNNLADNVAVSEIYVVPADLDPEKIDPKTGEKEAPILMIDKIRMGLETEVEEEPVDPAAPEAVEIYEYRALQAQMAKLRTIAPKLVASTESEIPFFSIGSLITCDNHVYEKTHDDADRRGPIYSVPFYGEDGLLKGTISAIMLDSAIRGLLPETDAALIDTASRGLFLATKKGQQSQSMESVAKAVPDATLIYSEVLTVPTKDPARQFRLWTGRPRAEFLGSDAVRQIDTFQRLGYLFAVATGMLILGAWALLRRSLNKAKADATLAFSLAERNKEILALEASQTTVREAAEHDRRLADQQLAADAARIAAEQKQIVAGIAAGLNLLAEGDLTVRLNEPYPPAYEQLREDFNRAVEKLQHSMAKVTRSVHVIRGGGAAMSNAADNLAQRNEHQAASLEQTAAALSEITSTVRNTADGAHHAHKVVEMAKMDAERSGVIVRQTIEAMEDIEQASAKINQIIGVIDAIAFQTNLLALNAGVEAARAGDAGKGFAVVAAEVRGLAQRTADAARQIKDLVTNSHAQVEKGVALVGNSGQVLDEIAGRVSEINDIVATITASAQSQADSLNQVNIAIGDMDQLTQKNAAMAEETTAESHGLSNEAEQLATLISMFRIEPVDQGSRRAQTRAQFAA